MPLSRQAQQSLNKLLRKATSFEPSLNRFVKQYIGLCINTFVISVLFLSLGIPNVIHYRNHGTRDILNQHVTISIEKMSQTSTGAIASGVFGSGVFPVSLLLFLFANGMIAYEMIRYYYCPSIKELERRIDNISISKRMERMKQMSILHKEDMMSTGIETASLYPVS